MLFWIFHYLLLVICSRYLFLLYFSLRFLPRKLKYLRSLYYQLIPAMLNENLFIKLLSFPLLPHFLNHSILNLFVEVSDLFLLNQLSKVLNCSIFYYFLNPKRKWRNFLRYSCIRLTLQNLISPNYSTQVKDVWGILNLRNNQINYKFLLHQYYFLLAQQLNNYHYFIKTQLIPHNLHPQ